MRSLIGSPLLEGSKEVLFFFLRTRERKTTSFPLSEMFVMIFFGLSFFLRRTLALRIFYEHPH